MADDETLAWVTLMVSALSAVFLGIRALKAVTAKLVAAKGRVIGLREPVVCPNCEQPFDAWPFPRVDGRRTVTCPRCWYTFEA